MAVVVVFTNTSDATCTLEGYSSAWFVDPAGARMGPTSIEEAGPAPSLVTLPPGSQASTTIWTDNPQVLDPSYCEPSAAGGINVIPPGQSSILIASITDTICGTNNSVGTTPVTAGTSENMF